MRPYGTFFQGRLDMEDQAFVDDAVLQFRKIKTMGDRALDQAGEGPLFNKPDLGRFELRRVY
jgi:hypothetical protein